MSEAEHHSFVSTATDPKQKDKIRFLEELDVFTVNNNKNRSEKDTGICSSYQSNGNVDTQTEERTERKTCDYVI